MQFDLKKFLQTGRDPYRAELNFDLSGYDFPGYRVNKPVVGVFTAQPTGDGVVIDLTVEACVDAECARCLDEVHQECSIQREWLVRENDLTGDLLELPIDEAGKLPIEELVCEELVMEVPPVLLCSSDCKGLCPVCGKPKASGCTCCPEGSTTPVDERLAILKQLLN